MRATIVIIPTFNEAGNIDPLVREVLRVLPDGEVLVVDDESPDGTAAVVRRLQADFPDRVHLEVRRGARGLGHAYVHGYRWALARDFAFIAGMDADFSHPPEALPCLQGRCAAGAAMAVGSRYVPGGGVRDWSLYRRFLSRSASRYARMILGWPVADATSGFVCYRREALAGVDLAAIQFVGYAFLIEMKYGIFRRGLRLEEVPILFVDRKVGSSKMSARIFHEALWGVWWLKFHR